MPRRRRGRRPSAARLHCGPRPPGKTPRRRRILVRSTCRDNRPGYPGRRRLAIGPSRRFSPSQDRWQPPRRCSAGGSTAGRRGTRDRWACYRRATRRCGLPRPDGRRLFARPEPHGAPPARLSPDRHRLRINRFAAPRAIVPCRRSGSDSRAIEIRRALPAHGRRRLRRRRRPSVRLPLRPALSMLSVGCSTDDGWRLDGIGIPTRAIAWPIPLRQSRQRRWGRPERRRRRRARCPRRDAADPDQCPVRRRPVAATRAFRRWRPPAPRAEFPLGFHPTRRDGPSATRGDRGKRSRPVAGPLFPPVRRRSTGAFRC